MNWILNLWNDKRCQAAEQHVSQSTANHIETLTGDVEHLESELNQCREKLEAEQVKCRILQLEVELLANVHARDLTRWQQEHPVGSTDK